MGSRFRPEHVDRLLGEVRRAVLPPDRVVDLLDLAPADTVADIGAGPGYFTEVLARRTGGTIYAVDVEPKMLEILRDRWPGGPPDRVRLVQGSAERLPLPDASVDKVLYAFVLHEADDLDEVVRECTRVVRPGGRAVLVEWKKEFGEEGPPVNERLEPGELASRFRALGWQVEGPLDLNGRHYALTARLPGEGKVRRKGEQR